MTLKVIVRSLAFFTTLILFSCNSDRYQPDIVIRGGTLLDLSNLGRSEKDINESLILIKDGRIIYAGEHNDSITYRNPGHIIEADGKYILPGLIDGFAAMNNQSYANAYLWSGITHIIAVDGGRRGPFYSNADPSPGVSRLESVGDELLPLEEHLLDLEELSNLGYKVALLKYKLTPEQLPPLKARAAELGMVTIGELGYSSYYDGVNADLQAFVHTTRYSLDLAPQSISGPVADQPFSDDLDSPKWRYYRYLYSLDLRLKRVSDHAKMFSASSSFLMPTFSLLYLDLPDHENPWTETVASLIDPGDVNNPADRITGNHSYDSIVQQNYTKLALQQLKLEKIYFETGARYLAGSATDVWGTMPGISLHTELQLLAKIGLSNREVIATATANFHDAFGWMIGLVKKDFEADLIILEKNPLEDLKHLKSIHQLILEGEMIDRHNLLNYEN